MTEQHVSREVHLPIRIKNFVIRSSKRQVRAGLASSIPPGSESISSSDVREPGLCFKLEFWDYTEWGVIGGFQALGYGRESPSALAWLGQRVPAFVSCDALDLEPAPNFARISIVSLLHPLVLLSGSSSGRCGGGLGAHGYSCCCCFGWYLVTGILLAQNNYFPWETHTPRASLDLCLFSRDSVTHLFTNGLGHLFIHF